MQFILNLLKNSIKTLSFAYYNIAKPTENGSKYIPASGKVLGKEELSNMLDATLDMWLTAGHFNEEFEKKLANFFNVKHALSVNSGSSANLLAISALTSYKLGDRKLNKGDEVITVAAGFPTTVNPIVQNGLIPVFIDVEKETYNIDSSQISAAITPKTKAIFIAHTLGNVFNLDEISKICEKYNLWLIEDNCDAFGARFENKLTGTFGHIGTLSFYPAHHITTGEGGALITNDTQLYRILMSFRDWGRDCWCPPGKDNSCHKRFSYKLGNLPFGYDHKYTYSHVGYNLKITDWQAACGLAQLDKAEMFINKRWLHFKYLYAGLRKFEKYLILPKAIPNAEPSWFGFIITIKENEYFSKQELVKYLESHNVGTRELFAGNLLRQPSFVEHDIKLRIKNSGILNSKNLTDSEYQMLPITENIMKNSFWIGLWPGLKKEQLTYVIRIFDEFINLKTKEKPKIKV
ncbi:MAG: lipopolysaccharide biosynthesis protein RfbH [Candidatus Gastranaerophilales bacterium]|nr:lipopolysaccharide biosynthesis protein RfbH [Candidatus Gastranaerophilales bacterium]